MGSGIFYVYGMYRTRERAEAAFENMVAFGEVSECELHRIEKRGAVWCIVLRG